MEIIGSWSPKYDHYKNTQIHLTFSCTSYNCETIYNIEEEGKWGNKITFFSYIKLHVYKSIM